jgi:glycosyltransferase involved in cell wall biosynthesis
MKNRQKFLIVHGIDVWKKLPIFQLFGISHIQKILSVSSFTREQMSKNNNVDFDRFLIFPNTLDPFYGNGKLPQTRDNLALPNGRMILCVSRLDASERYKGIDKLIEALPDVLERIPEAFCVVVGNGSDRSRLEKLKKDLELTDKVIFTGWVSNGLLASYYRACDVFVLPSSQEGFGIVFLEAMYYAKPCVGVGAGAIPEIVENGKTGFVTKLGNVGSIADCLVHLLSNESLCESMGGAGKERLEQEYSFEKFRKRLEAILYS